MACAASKWRANSRARRREPLDVFAQPRRLPELFAQRHLVEDQRDERLLVVAQSGVPAQIPLDPRRLAVPPPPALVLDQALDRSALNFGPSPHAVEPPPAHPGPHVPQLATVHPGLAFFKRLESVRRETSDEVGREVAGRIGRAPRRVPPRGQSGNRPLEPRHEDDLRPPRRDRRIRPPGPPPAGLRQRRPFDGAVPPGPG